MRRSIQEFQGIEHNEGVGRSERHIVGVVLKTKYSVYSQLDQTVQEGKEYLMVNPG